MKVSSDLYLTTHLNGKKHKYAVEKANVTPEQGCDCIVTIPIAAALSTDSPLGENETKERNELFKKESKIARQVKFLKLINVDVDLF
jgi:hypothetical protein